MTITKQRRIFWRSIILVLPIVLYFVCEYLATVVQPDRFETHKFQLSLPLSEAFRQQNQLPEDHKIERIVVAGFFSDWNTDNPAYDLFKSGDSLWTKSLDLPVGPVQYKYVLYYKNQPSPYWVNDPNNPGTINDSFGGSNSVVNIPDYQSILEILQFCLLIIFGFSLTYFVLQKFFLWLLSRRMPLAKKIVSSTLIVVFLSNSMLVVYQIIEYRQLVKQSVVDSVHTFHLGLQQFEIDFSDLRSQHGKLAAAMPTMLWEAKTRVEKNQLSIMQITLSDVAILDKDFKLVHVQNRQQNARLQERRRDESGFKELEDYYMQGVFGPTIVKAKNALAANVLTGNPSAEIAAIETRETSLARRALGFSNVLVPIDIEGSVTGYYVASLQVKLYGNEIRRIMAINLLLIGVVLILCYALLNSVAEIFTYNLKRLTSWTKRINKGDFADTVKINTQDEAQELAENFAIMQDSLKSSFEKIEEQNAQLNKAAYTDIQTGLRNQNKLLRDMCEYRFHSLIVLEILDYEKLLGFLGEQFVADLVDEVVERLTEEINQERGATLYRLTANQFCTLSEDSHTNHLKGFTSKLLECISREPLKIGQITLKVGLVAGICGAEFDMEQPASQVDKAQQAVSAAKSRSEKIRFYNPSMEPHRDLAKNIALINRLRDALQSNRLVPFFQPIVETKSMRVFAYEGLARVFETDHNIIPPNEFLPAAKHCGLYPSISQTMLEQCILICREQDVRITLNLSAMDIENYQSKQFLSQWMQANKDILSRVTFEITETDKIEDYALMKVFIDKISEMGCSVALDDFGAGYSNFTHLLSLNVDYIKIDGSLIRNLDVDENARLITTAIVECAKALNIKTVAEYVHSEQIYELVKQLGVDYCQGYYFGAPSPELKLSQELVTGTNANAQGE
ncbi:EAL domain-containing protein [Aliiglaciecola sp. M165]|uniref:EAL domain-containing protein n=1 Tax=Aliiglaciecola sp. M165 TaxID=2593649 RepID=UPI0011809186|nr:EAL domain-containing protein [Aliiglaciecola sp. M165]TRY33958.1 EAL domain-containing protein [Aliiglaciecola sp. M165]